MAIRCITYGLTAVFVTEVLRVANTAFLSCFVVGILILGKSIVATIARRLD
jgi:hypothetical protein